MCVRLNMFLSASYDLALADLADLAILSRMTFLQFLQQRGFQCNQDTNHCQEEYHFT
jgi:hypothetical protein